MIREKEEERRKASECTHLLFFSTGNLACPMKSFGVEFGINMVGVALTMLVTSARNEDENKIILHSLEIQLVKRRGGRQREREREREREEDEDEDGAIVKQKEMERDR